MLKYNIARTQINNWIKNKSRFLSPDSLKLNKTTMHKDKPPLNTQLANGIIRI